MNSPKQLLVIRLSAMGDVAMVVPVLSALTQQYPDVKITVLTRGFFKPLFEQLPNVTVFEADVKGEHKGVLGLWKLFRALQKLNIYAVADVHNVLRSNILKVFFKITGFQVVQIDKGRVEKKALTRTRNKNFKALKTTHQRYVDVFEALGFPVKLSAEAILPKRILSKKINEIVTSQNKILIGIAPFAAFVGKMYPLDLMEKVVSELNKIANYQIVLFGGGDKEKMELNKWVSKYANVLSIVGELTFSEELDLISNLKLMLAMDSGNAHLAANFGCPVVSLWGVTHPYAGFYPFDQNINNALLSDRTKYPLIPTSIYGNKIPLGYEDAMRSIHPDEVVQKIQTILE